MPILPEWKYLQVNWICGSKAPGRALRGSYKCRTIRVYMVHGKEWRLVCIQEQRGPKTKLCEISTFKIVKMRKKNQRRLKRNDQYNKRIGVVTWKPGNSRIFSFSSLAPLAVSQTSSLLRIPLGKINLLLQNQSMYAFRSLLVLCISWSMLPFPV